MADNHEMPHPLSTFLLGTAVLMTGASLMPTDLVFRDGFESGDAVAWGFESTVKIVMDNATVTQLLNGGFELYGFKAVWSTDGAGAPLVWFGTRNYAINTFVTWWSDLTAYTSREAIANGRQIRPGATTGIELGQLWKVDSTGTGPVFIDGVKGAVAIQNASQIELTCGLAQSVLDTSSPAAPYCAFPLFPGFVDAIVPLEKILLIFSTNEVLPGTAVVGPFIDLPCNACTTRQPLLRTATGPGILIDMAGQTNLTVSFELQNGWTWGPSVAARTVAPTEDLVPLLIESD